MVPRKTNQVFQLLVAVVTQYVPKPGKETKTPFFFILKTVKVLVEY